jgi:hypothetical protein
VLIVESISAPEKASKSRLTRLIPCLV